MTKTTTITSLLVLIAGLVACGDEATSTGQPKCEGGGANASTTSTDGAGAQGAGASSAEGGGGTGASTSTGVSEPDPNEEGTGNPDNTFDHMNDPGSSGKKDPFEILKERAEEGPPEIRSRLHGCTKLRYDALGAFLSSRGVNLAATAPNGSPKTAGQLYAEGRDALGVAKFEAREAEAYFHTTSGATKLFDIFIQASPEIIANIQDAEACKLGGVGFPMFDAEGACVREALTCVMGRPATSDDLILCSQLAQDHDGSEADTNRKRQLAVAAFLSAAHTCE
jgi:hypothetical protein